MNTIIINTTPTSPTDWITMEPAPRDPQVRNRCSIEFVQEAIAFMDGLTVESVTINDTGSVEQLPGIVASDLPDFCDIRISQKTPGGHTAHITVWVPLDWNGRFLGVGGQGNRASVPWIFGDLVRLATLPRAIRNGFAAAETDAGNRDMRFAEWGLDPDTRELDWDLIRNWLDRSTHDMTVVGKAVTSAIRGETPRYSYFQGTSGGGRQALMEAQRYPDDYDGIWSAEPALNWSKLSPAGIWPALVMKEYQNPLAAAKLEAFRQGVLAADGPDASRDGFHAGADVSTWDPHELVGQPTTAGQITSRDADVMARIWEGPRNSEGEFLWYGLRPGGESWGENIHRVGIAQTAEINGELTPVPFVMATAHLGQWLLRDPEWDWTTLTFEQFEQLFEQSVREFSYLDTDDPDLSGYRDSGGKLLLTHGLADEIIFSAGTMQYVDRVFSEMGGHAGVDDFLRTFFTPGDGHSHVTAAGPGLTLAQGMTVLMAWVEGNRPPDEIDVERYNTSGEVTMRRTARKYQSRSGVKDDAS